MRSFKAGIYALSLLSATMLMADAPALKQPTADPCPKYFGNCPSWAVGGDVGVALDYFRSLPDGSWGGNFGAFTAVNLGVRLPKVKSGWGIQAGGSYGLYDWDGRGSNTMSNSGALQQQGFVTLGLFKVTHHCSGINFGVVYDWMFNKNASVFYLNPTIAQVRGQIAYLLKSGNEIGFWGTCNTETSTKEAQEIPVTFHAISQVNFFWRHYFKNQAQTLLWAGTPYRRGLMYSSGRAGQYIFGGSFRAPLTKAWSLDGHAAYMGAKRGPATTESRDYAANISLGITYSFGGCKAGERPYLPLADNSNFLVDSNTNY